MLTLIACCASTLLFAQRAPFSATIVSELVNNPEPGKDLVAVYRWYDPGHKTFITATENECSKNESTKVGTDKKLLFYAYTQPGANRVPVYGWHNPGTHNYITFAESEWTDEQMMKKGYTGKHIQFYALNRKGPNAVTVFRWLHKDAGWITATEAETDELLSKGVHRKTYQYFGISPEVDPTR